MNMKAAKKALKVGDIVRRKIMVWNPKDEFGVPNKEVKKVCAYADTYDEDKNYDSRPIMLNNEIELINFYPEVLEGTTLYANIEITDDRGERYYIGRIDFETLSGDKLDPTRKIVFKDISTKDASEGLYAKINEGRITYVLRIKFEDGTVEVPFPLKSLSTKLNIDPAVIAKIERFMKDEIELIKKYMNSSS